MIPYSYETMLAKAFECARLYLIEHGRDFSVSADIERKMLDGKTIEIDVEQGR